MFLELWLKFCCSQRQKNDLQEQQAMETEKNTTSQTRLGSSGQGQKIGLTNSQEELRMKISQLSKGSRKQEVKTSLEMEVEPVEGFLQLSDNKSAKIASWELLESQRQAEILNQLSGFTKLAQSISSNNNSNSLHLSQQLSQQFSQHLAQLNNSGMSNVYNHLNQNLANGNNLAQTIHLSTIDECPNKSLIRSTSFSAIEKKKIAKEKKERKEKKEKKEKKNKIESKEKKTDKQAKLWDQSEDAILKKCFEEFNGNWREIAQHLPGRNMNQCAQRWRRLNPQSNDKKKWSFEDDEKIKQLVQKLGKNWAEIAKQFPNKTGKQVRERFLNKLDPNINLSNWTTQEDEIILQVYKEHGPKWSIASKKLNGRPENMVKNRFYSYIRRVVLGQQNPYSIVLNQNTKDMMNEQSVESDSQKVPYSFEQSGSSFTGQSLLSSYLDSDYMDNDDIMEDQFKI